MSIELIFIVLIVILANIIEASDNGFIKRNFPWILFVINLPLMLMGFVLTFASTDTLTAFFTEPALNSDAIRLQGINFLWISLVGAVFVFPLCRDLIARITNLDADNNVHALAILLSGYLVGLSVASLTLGGLEALADLDISQDIWSVITQQALFAALGIFGPGIVIRRNWPELQKRLGLVSLRPRQILLAMAWVIPLVILQWAAGAIWILISPEQVELFDSINGALLGNIDTWWEWLLLAIASGIGEELLFRGAIQPRFGLWFTVLLFTVAHTQYALSPATLVIAVFAYLLGILRREHGTTFTMIVHFGYNFALGILALVAENIVV